MIAFSNIVEYKRTKEGDYIGGFYTPGKSESIKINSNIQPHFYKEADFRVEGREVSSAIKIYTPVKLIAKENGYQADTLIYNGVKYEVYQVKDYSGYNMMPHFKSVALAFNEGEQ